MAIIASTGKLRNKIETLWRVCDSAWFGRDVGAYEQPPNVLNGESLLSVNAAGTGTVPMLSVSNTNVVTAPSGLTIPAGQPFSNQGTSTRATNNGLVAKAGGGQAGATALTFSINRVITVTTAGDSVLLPPSVVGANVVVINAAAANATNIYPSTGDNINILGVNNPFSLVANKTVEFYCGLAGTWNSILSA